MLTQKQIRKLARALSDRQICDDPNADEVLLAPGLWTNKIMALFEPPPAAVQNWHSAQEASPSHLAAVESLCSLASRPVYPTFMGQPLDADCPLIRFEAPGLTLWADARSVSTAIKKAGRGGRLEFAAAPSVILITNGGPRLALLAALACAPADVECWSWTLENRDLPAQACPRENGGQPLPRPTGPACPRENGGQPLPRPTGPACPRENGGQLAPVSPTLANRKEPETMKLSAKAQAALDTVVEKFRQGDLSPVVEIARLQRQPGDTFPADDWSLCNRVMAYVQTGSLDCRGYRQWQQVGRQVKKGSHAAYILAPLHVAVEDEQTGETRQALRGFKSIPVFAYHDTEGEPIPEFDYSPRDLPPLVDVAQRLGVEVTWQPLPPDRLGGCSVDGSRIRLASHDAAVFFHELAHAAHARLNGGQLKGGQHTGQETVAEFTAAVLMQFYGLQDRSGNAWRYIQGYAKDPLKAIVKALSTVEKVLHLLEIT